MKSLWTQIQIQYGYRSNYDFLTAAIIVAFKPFFKPQRENILIKISDHHREKVVGSLRFNYMIPVPEKCLHIFDFKNSIENNERRIFIEKEYRFCKSKLSAIQKIAKRTYNRVTEKVDIALVRNSCDFKLLEQAYDEYVRKYM